MNMQSFKLFWENYTNKKSLFYSWISPTGKIFPVQSTHERAKYDIMKQENLKPRVKGEYADMFDLGFARLLLHNNTVYIQNDLNYPTPRQVKVVKDLCIENGIEEFRLDLGGRESRLLWSRGE
jgi:hypothetical protein